MEVGSVVKSNGKVGNSKDYLVNKAITQTYSERTAQVATASAAVNTSIASASVSKEIQQNASNHAEQSIKNFSNYTNDGSQTSGAAVNTSETNSAKESVQKMREFEESTRAKEQEKREAEESLSKAKEIIADLNQKQLALRFATSEKFEDKRVINVVDTQSNKVIRQIPSEEFLRVSDTIAKYEQRMAHDDMVADPKLKAQGVDTANVNENLRGAMFDSMA